MSLVAMTIPDDPDELAEWLERHLAGLDLTRLVAELSAVHGPPPEAVSFEQTLGPYVKPICHGGLSVLPRPLLTRLLTQPSLLLELQEPILLEGGPYWDRVLKGNRDLDDLVARGRRRVEALVRGGTASGGRAAGPATLRLRWHSRPWFVSLATAAAVLLAVGLWSAARPGGPPAPAATAWGWDRPGALPRGVGRAEYLNALADDAEEWFNKRPETAPELARRILQLRQGCDTLLLGEHEPLPGPDREWLKARCRKWADQFDRQLAALESGKDPREVREAVDDSVRKLAGALRARAAQAA
jgi:hypothetical protein